MTEPSEAMGAEARSIVFPKLWAKAKSRHYYTGDPDSGQPEGAPHFAEVAFAEGMAHAAELIRADLAVLSATPKAPATARVETFRNAAHGGEVSAAVRLESGHRGKCFGEPSSRAGILVATDRALIQERIANGEWLKSIGKK